MAHLPGDVLASEDILNKILLAGGPQSILQIVEEEVSKLLGVLLDGHIGWVTLIVFV